MQNNALNFSLGSEQRENDDNIDEHDWPLSRKPQVALDIPNILLILNWSL